MSRRLFLTLLLTPLLVQAAPRGHSHNDYWRDRPLFDALDAGFSSVEADVFLVDGELLVGHDLSELRAGRTLESLYLAPLAKLVEQHGRVPVGPQDAPFILLIDIKSDSLETYQAIHATLEHYEPMLVSVRDGQVKPGAIQAVISGRRPRQFMLGQTVRFAGYDGSPGDLDQDWPTHFMPMVSANWRERFGWIGGGAMPEPQRQRLLELTAKAREKNRLIRFWGGPNDPALWRAQIEAGVTLINADNLTEAAAVIAQTTQ